MKTSVRVIWEGKRDKTPHQIYLMPDGVGTCFTTFQNTLFFATYPRPEGAYLLKIDLPTQKTSVVYRSDGYIVGVHCGGPDRLLLIVSRHSGDFLVSLSPDGRLQRQTAIGEQEREHSTRRVPLAPPLWMRLLDRQTLLLYSYGGDGTLFAFSLHGHVVRKWQGVSGVAFDPVRKRIYASGNVRGTEIHRVKPPRSMLSPAWRLVGVDREARFYWYRQTQSRSWLACADGRRMRWSIPLSGKDGVLEKLPHAGGFGLGWGGDSLEVFPDGRVWLSSSRMVGGETPTALPAVYEIRVVDK